MKITKVFNHLHLWFVAVLLGVDGLFFTMTDPASAPSLALMVGFILLVATLYCLVKGVLRIGAWYGLSAGRQQGKLAAACTGLLGGIVALQSIGELSARDILVLVPIVVIVYLYTSYGKASRES